MGADVADRFPVAHDVYQQANDILGFDLADLCFAGPAERLGQTDIQQPAIFVTSVAIWKAFEASGGSLDQFRFTAGLSLGEYTALHIAGAMHFEAALQLVRRRGQLMQEAALALPSGMVSLIGADDATALAICDKARGDSVLAPANYNCPGQIVISGSSGACERAVEAAEQFKCRAVALKVAGAFHSPLMASAAAALEEVLGQTEFRAPDIPVISNVNGQPHRDPESTRQTLKDQVTRPVLWQRSIEQMIEDGVSSFVEVGPGRVLTGLMRKINRKMTAVNVSNAESIGAATAVARSN